RAAVIRTADRGPPPMFSITCANVPKAPGLARPIEPNEGVARLITDTWRLGHERATYHADGWTGAWRAVYVRPRLERPGALVSALTFPNAVHFGRTAGARISRF